MGVSGRKSKRKSFRERTCNDSFSLAQISRRNKGAQMKGISTLGCFIEHTLCQVIAVDKHDVISQKVPAEKADATHGPRARSDQDQ